MGGTTGKTKDILLRSRISMKDLEGDPAVWKGPIDFFRVRAIIMASARSDPALAMISATSKCYHSGPLSVTE